MWFDLANLMLQAVCVALNDDAGAQPCPPRSGVLVGDVAWDDCCNGQLWVRVTRVFQSSTFPQEDISAQPCGGPYAAQFELGLLRCAPTITENGAPSVEALEASAQMTYYEAELLRRTVACSLTDWRKSYLDPVFKAVTNGEVIDVSFIGAEGGCIGSQVTFVVGLDS